MPRPHLLNEGLAVSIVALLSGCGDSGSSPTTTPTPLVPLACTVSGVVSVEPNPPTITFDEPEIAATWATTYSAGTYTTCPFHYSPNFSTFTIRNVTFTGNYYFRSLWNGCSSDHPEIWTGGVLQSSNSVLSLVFQNSSPTDVRFSLGVDGAFPDTRFDIVATAGDETAAVTAAVSLGRIRLSCTRGVGSIAITHTGPNWILDSLSF